MKRETKIIENKGGLDMGAVKGWLMEHDECIGDAITNGAKSVEDVIAYCKTNMTMIDEGYIREQWDEFMAGPDSMTPDEIRDLDNTSLSEGY
jgi:hypothetical protein